MATHRDPDTTTRGGAPGAAETPGKSSNFLREIVEADVRSGKHGGRVVTRFPPEPNGYLHIGHAKSICLNFGLARDFGGACHLRFDDTNPSTEDVEYVDAIQRDVRWLGSSTEAPAEPSLFEWKDKLFFASDYHGRLLEFAEQLVRAGKAYVCSLSEDEFRLVRGTITEPGRPSPYRDRTIDENLDLLRRMRAGEFPDGAHVLRAKIDLASPNMKMRDPPLVRIRHAHHYRTGDAFCVYPLYDFAHCLSDWIEGITHSICTLEFENNRELYDWILEAVEVPDRPRQYEFARLNLSFTMMSKRKLLELVEKRHVSGWDDPRMPTVAGLRRRGYTPEAIRELCERVGVARNNGVVELALLEHVLREDLNLRSPRVLGVLRPLRVVLENYPEGQVEQLDAPYWPADVPREGSRPLPFDRVLYVDRDDFLEEPPKDFHRLAPGREVRLRHAYVVRCTSVVKDPQTGEVVELRCSYDPASRTPEGAARKVKGTIHWVSAAHALDAEVRLYDRLFTSEQPGGSEDLASELNPESLVTVRAKVEPSLAAAKPGERYQLERQGFFFVDPADSKPGAPVFNRTVALKDGWAKVARASAAAEKGPPSPAAKPAEVAVAPPVREVAAELSAEALALVKQHGLAAEDARILASEPAYRAFFGEAVGAHPSPRAIANWTVNEVLRAARGSGAKELPFPGRDLGELVALVEAGTISGPLAKEVFEEMRKGGGRPQAIVEKRGLRQITDAGALEPIVAAVLAENADAVARYRAGNANLLGAFVGMVMKRTGGKASPPLVQTLLRARLASGEGG